MRRASYSGNRRGSNSRIRRHDGDSMSELRADTITGSDGTSPVTLTKQSAAKTVVNFQGSGTATLNGSPLNASSLDDRGTGLYTVNYTNSFSDTNYITASHVRDGGGELILD